MQLPKPNIERIEFSGEDKQYIDAMIEGVPTPRLLKYWTNKGVNIEHHIKWYTPPQVKESMRTLSQRYKISMCQICRSFPSYKVIFKMHGINLVEYFCSEHLPNELES
jgi:hypothetical protein